MSQNKTPVTKAPHQQEFSKAIFSPLLIKAEIRKKKKTFNVATLESGTKRFTEAPKSVFPDGEVRLKFQKRAKDTEYLCSPSQDVLQSIIVWASVSPC